MSHIKDRLSDYHDFMKKIVDDHQMVLASGVLEMIEHLQDDLEQDEKENDWIPVSDMPNCCGYPVLLTVENEFGQREVCKAFTNYMKEGKQLFYTNEKEFCAELTSSKLSEAWKPIAWMHLPEAYKED